MLYLPIKNVRPGMVVAKPVCHARNRVYFVQKGYALDHRTLARLTALGVHSLWIECAGMEEVDERINDVVIEKRQDLGHVLTSSIDDLRQRTDKATESAPFESKVGGLLAEILDDPFHEPLLATMSGDCGALVRHLSNCCYVCLLLGTHLSGYVRRQRRRIPARIAEDVQQLGMGAFLHDLGKVRLPEEAQDIHALHPRRDDTEYQSHAKMGVELLRGEFSPLAIYVVAHHHQRFDGSGFPKVKPRDLAGEAAGLRGEKIHIFARILAVADAFDHLLGTPQAPKPTIQALHALQQPHFAGWFDPLVVAAVNRLIPPFMIGSVVTLTDGQEAVVTDNHAVAPCRPTVRIISGGLGTPGAFVHDEDLDLRTTLGLSVGEVDGIDVRPFFFEPPDIPEGVMAYWGLRSKAVKTASVDPVELLPAQETVPARS